MSESAGGSVEGEAAAGAGLACRVEQLRDVRREDALHVRDQRLCVCVCVCVCVCARATAVVNEWASASVTISFDHYF